MEERNEIMEMNNETTEVADYDVDQSSGGGLGKVLVGVGLLAVAGVTAVVVKNKDKIEARRIEKLRKKGYVIYHEDDVEDVIQVDEDEDAEELIEEKVTEIKKRKEK